MNRFASQGSYGHYDPLNNSVEFPNVLIQGHEAIPPYSQVSSTLGWRSQSRINQSGIMDAFIGPGNCFSVKDEVSAYRDFALPSGPSTTLGAFQPPTVPQPTSYVLLEPSTLLISDVVHAQVYSKLLPKIS